MLIFTMKPFAGRAWLSQRLCVLRRSSSDTRRLRHVYSCRHYEFMQALATIDAHLNIEKLSELHHRGQSTRNNEGMRI